MQNDKKWDANNEKLLELLLQGEKNRAVAFLDEWGGVHGFRSAFTRLMEPVLVEIGERWSSDNLSLAQGYVAAKVAEELLLRVLPETAEQEATLSRGPVVLGNVEDDFHSLGRKLVSIFLRSAGWKVIDLGNDVPASEYVDTALKTGARIIGVSAMMFTTAENITKIREEIDRRDLKGKILLAVGGAVFKIRPELATEVGADGTAASAVEAIALFERLTDSFSGAIAP